MLPAWFHNIQERHESLREPPSPAACGVCGLGKVGGGATVLCAGDFLDVPASCKSPGAHRPAFLGWVFLLGWQLHVVPEHGVG